MSCAATLNCKQEQRRSLVRDTEHLNGLDYLEVGEDQLTLTVFFLGKAPLHLEKENFRIEGGRRVTGIQVAGLRIDRDEDPEIDDCVHITVNKPGDFSTYCLCLIEIDPEIKKPVVEIDENCKKHFKRMSGIDPRYACLEFNFKAGCPSDLDCKPQLACPPEKRPEPEINYLAKDYASFRQLILDRLALTMPDWKERHVPDLGTTLVELLAYVGDHLSYYQDAVATEAYLDTARLRTSVRRHVRLVDYQLHEGCNARTWACFSVAGDLTDLKPDDFYLITDPGIATLGTVLDHTALPKTLPKPYLIFEPLVDNRNKTLSFYSLHNEIALYTWGDTQCCLPKGSTSATLLDPGEAKPPVLVTSHESKPHPEPAKDKKESAIHPPKDSDYLLNLQPCDIILFEEVKGPKTGSIADADPSHRHAVRLTKAGMTQDPLTGKLLWEIEWSKEDALPFPLCISSIKKGDCSLISDVSVVRGNVLWVDHGETILTSKDDVLGPVPSEPVLADCGNDCIPRESTNIPGRFGPPLPKADLTFSQPLLPCRSKEQICSPKPKLTPASALLKQDVKLAMPQVWLREVRLESDQLVQVDQPVWEARLDLLSSDAEDTHFVVEMEDDRRARLRFGNNELGRFPDADTLFQAVYRVGNGSVGNVGADSITRIVFRNNLPNGAEITVRNPLPAMGGVNPEPVAEAKLFAPYAFRKTLQRAITADDYAQIVMRDFAGKVQRAAAKLLWTGSWYEVLVAIDPEGTEETDPELLCEIRHHLYRYQRIGHDVIVAQATYVPLDIAMTVCVLPHYLRGHVNAALLEVFSNRISSDGSKGFFHPDNLSFGENIYLSKLVAAAQAVEGVESVVVTKLRRFSVNSADSLPSSSETDEALISGLIKLGSFEVAQLDNDPSFPENGRFILDMRGGR
jgi:hypothetical protein